MAVNLSTFNFKKLPWVCISALIVVVAVQFLFAFNPLLQDALFTFSEPSLSDPLRLDIFYKKAESSPQKKVFLIGTSQGREAFNASVLTERFDRKIGFYNMGSAAYSAIDFYMEIDRIIDAKPDLLVYMPYIGNFYLDYDFKRLKYYYNPKVLPFISKDIGTHVFLEKKWFIFDAYLSDALYFYKYREGLKPILFNVLDYMIFRLGKTVEPKYFRYDTSRGSEYFENQVRAFKGSKFYFSQYTDIEKQALQKVIDSIQKSKIPFIIIDGPVNPKIAGAYEFEVGTAYDEFLAEIADVNHVTFLSKADMPQFPSDQFIDFTHLNSAGRAKFTDFFAEYLQANYTQLLQE